MKPKNVRIQNCSTQTGIEKNPVICWEYENGGGSRKQHFCRIYMMQGPHIVYESKRMKTGQQNNHEIPLTLETHKQYKVFVETEDDTGRCEVSEGTSFFSGICNTEDWIGRWISNGSRQPHYVGTEMTIEKPVIFACLSLAGVGQYEVKINGNKPDDSVLNGSWTDYHKHIHYRTFEISNLLKPGENGITIEVGNGWYAPIADERHFYTRDKGYEPFGTCLCAIAALTIVYEDGEVCKIGTDDTWWTKKSETIYTNVYGSEDYDASAAVAEKLGQAVLAGEKAPKGRLVPMQYPPVMVKGVYHGIRLQTPENGGILYDLGQNMSGLFEITVRGKCGTKLRITPAEKLDQYGNPQKTTESWCTYTLKGEKAAEKWKPKFTYGAGRYIQIQLEPESEIHCDRGSDIRCDVYSDNSCEMCTDMHHSGFQMPEVLDVSGYFISTQAEDTGEFFCSDSRYMQIHELVLRAIESNLHHVHTDCPTIERLGWQEPNHLMGPSIMYVKYVETLWDKIAADQRDSQYLEGESDIDCGHFPHEYSAGLLPSIAPRYARFLQDCGEGSFWDIIPWGSSILLAAYEEYRFYGNKTTLIENYETAKRYVDYLYQKYCNYASIYNKAEGIRFLRHGLGDWGIEQNKGESRENIETAYLYRDMVILSEVAGWLGKKEEASYKALAEEVCQEYNKWLLVKNPATGEWLYKIYDKDEMTLTQAAQAIPLCFGMVPEEKIESVQRSFLLACEERTLRTGEIGLPYILRTLGEMGQADMVHDMMLRSRHPGYYRFIQNGETTLPEFWRDDARSRNHDMMGAILEWFYRYLAGISSENGFRTIRIKPVLPQSIDYVKCTYRSITGEVKVEARRMENKKLAVKVEIPENTSGEVIINGSSRQICGGLIYHLN